jgi:cytochrome c-type biogenesis protein CcsB
MKRILLILFLSILLANGSFAADGSAPAPHGGWDFTQAGLIPTQSGGRLKPFDSYARELVLYLTGSRAYQGWNPVDLMFSWLTYPAQWEQQDFIQVSREDVRRQLGLDEKRTHFTPKELLNNFPLMQYAQELSQKNTVTSPTGATEKQDQREQELKRVLDRVGLIRSIISGQGWLLIPEPTPAPWSDIASQSNEGKFIRSQFVELVKAYQAGNADLFRRNSVLVKAAVEGEIPGFADNSRRVILAESFYNRTHPFMIAWILYLIAALAWFVRLARSESITASYSAPGEKRTKVGRVAALAMIGAMIAHIGGFGLRCYIAGRPPVTNMYESVIWVSLGVVVFATVIYFVSKKQMVALAVACSLATLGLIAGDAAPAILDPGIHPLVPVLRSNYWLTIHVLTITLGYAAFALALGLADVTVYKFISGGEQKNRTQILALNQLTYRAMQFGVVLIAAGTILGGVWADYSWGRFWGWDPKEVWALIVLLCYLVILHGRYAGWVGQFGFAAWSVVSFLSVLMAWYGVNFILGVGLHSYGFSTGGFTGVMSFVVLQLSYVAFAMIRRTQFGGVKAKT